MSGLAPGHVPHYFCFFHHQHQAGWSIEGSRPETMSIQVNQIAACRHAHVLTNYLFDTINTFTSVTFDKGKKKSWETYCSLDSYSQSIIQQISIQQVYVSIQLWRSQESWRVFFLFSLHRQFGPVFVPGWVCLPAGHFQSRALVFRCWLWKWIPTSSYFLWSPVFVFCVNSEVNFGSHLLCRSLHRLLDNSPGNLSCPTEECYCSLLVPAPHSLKAHLPTHSPPLPHTWKPACPLTTTLTIITHWITTQCSHSPSPHSPVLTPIVVLTDPLWSSVQPVVPACPPPPSSQPHFVNKYLKLESCFFSLWASVKVKSWNKHVLSS